MTIRGGERRDEEGTRQSELIGDMCKAFEYSSYIIKCIMRDHITLRICPLTHPLIKTSENDGVTRPTNPVDNLA